MTAAVFPVDVGTFLLTLSPRPSCPTAVSYTHLDVYKRQQSRLHPRCGTSFLLIVMVISILVFSIIPWQQESFTHIPVIGVMFSAMPWAIWRLILRLLLLPIVAGISYEIIKFAGRHDNWFTRAISAPGTVSYTHLDDYLSRTCVATRL